MKNTFFATIFTFSIIGCLNFGKNEVSTSKKNSTDSGLGLGLNQEFKAEEIKRDTIKAISNEELWEEIKSKAVAKDIFELPDTLKIVDTSDVAYYQSGKRLSEVALFKLFGKKDTVSYPNQDMHSAFAYCEYPKFKLLFMVCPARYGGPELWLYSFSNDWKPLFYQQCTGNFIDGGSVEFWFTVFHNLDEFEFNQRTYWIDDPIYTVNISKNRLNSAGTLKLTREIKKDVKFKSFYDTF